MISACVAVSYSSVRGILCPDHRKRRAYLGHVSTDRVHLTIFGIYIVFDYLELLLGGLVRSLKLRIG